MHRTKGSNNTDYYDLLQVDKSATEDEIKKAYKKLAMKLHPDKGGDPEKFKELNEAYAVLSDENKRRMYDQFGTAEFGEGMGGASAMDVENLFGSLFGANFGGFGGMGGGMSRGKNKSQPKTYSLPVSLEEVFMGKKIMYRIKKKIFKGTSGKTCKDCQGSGQRIQKINMGFIVSQQISTCSSCSGSGKFYEDKDFIHVESEIEIPLPKGLPEGNTIVIREKGDEMPGVEPGDVHFVIQYKKHDVFRVSESESDPLDLYCDIPITLTEAFQGFKRSIPLLDGSILSIYQPKNIPLTKIINGPIEKVLDHDGLRFQNHVGSLHLHFQIVLPQSLELHLQVSEFQYPPLKNNFTGKEKASRNIDLSGI